MNDIAKLEAERDEEIRRRKKRQNKVKVKAELQSRKARIDRNGDGEKGICDLDRTSISKPGMRNPADGDRP